MVCSDSPTTAARSTTQTSLPSPVNHSHCMALTRRPATQSGQRSKPPRCQINLPPSHPLHLLLVNRVVSQLFSAIGILELSAPNILVYTGIIVRRPRHFWHRSFDNTETLRRNKDEPSTTQVDLVRLARKEVENTPCLPVQAAEEPKPEGKHAFSQQHPSVTQSEHFKKRQRMACE